MAALLFLEKMGSCVMVVRVWVRGRGDDFYIFIPQQTAQTRKRFVVIAIPFYVALSPITNNN
jgi:hypothetical protein